MAKNSEKMFRDLFIEMLENERLEEISVNKICERARVKRQTFYYHFESIYNLIANIFYNFNLKCSDNHSFQKIIQDLQGFFQENDHFLRLILDTYADDILKNYIFSYLFKNLKSLLKFKKLSYLLNNDEALNFLASGLTYYMYRRFVNGDYEDYKKIEFDFSTIFKNLPTILL